MKRILEQDRATFSNWRMTIDMLVAEGDPVAFYGTFSGRQEGPMGRFRPPGRR